MRPCAAARCGLRACALRLRFCTVIFDENALVSGAALWQYSALGWALRAEFFSRFPNFRTYTTCNANDSAPPKRERSKNGSSFTHYALRLYYNHEFTVQSSIEKYRVLLKSTTRSTRKAYSCFLTHFTLILGHILFHLFYYSPQVGLCVAPRHRRE